MVFLISKKYWHKNARKEFLWEELSQDQLIEDLTAPNVLSGDDESLIKQ